LTIQDLEHRFPTMNRRTLQRDLRGLIEKGLVVVEGATNQSSYRFRPETYTCDILATQLATDAARRRA
jgi:DNA-binding HxlR family transcriptional regulator